MAIPSDYQANSFLFWEESSCCYQDRCLNHPYPPVPSSQCAVYLCQVQVGLRQQVRVMFGHQANHIIKHPVLLVHGYGEVGLLHCGKQPARTRTRTHTHTHTHTHTQATITTFVFILVFECQKKSEKAFERWVSLHIMERNDPPAAKHCVYYFSWSSWGAR